MAIATARPRYLYHKSRDTDRPLITAGILIRRSRAERPLRNPKSPSPASGGRSEPAPYLIRGWGQTSGVSTHDSPPSQSSPSRGKRLCVPTNELRKGLCRRDPTPPPPLDSCLRRNDVSGPSSHQVMSPTPTGERGKLHGNADDAPLQPRHLYRLVLQVCEGRRLQRLTFVYASAGVG